MATLRVINSDSSGNGYILDCDGEKLIIELGCSWNDILCNLNYDLSRVCAALVTHKHHDHAKSISNALKYGLSVYSTKDVQSICQDAKMLKKGVKTRIGNFTVQPIPVDHSCECYAFLIEHDDIGRLVFATDCESFPYKIKNVHHFLIEANYSEEIAIDNMCNGFDNRSLSNQHLEINDTIDALKRNYTPSLQNIFLLHLSSGNSNADEFKQRVKDELGFSNVYVADKGLTIKLDKDEF
jgi:phosphoribosyl 1,2-cyclic phosphodiesterase